MTCSCPVNKLRHSTHLISKLYIELEKIFPKCLAGMIATYHIFCADYQICTRSCDATVWGTYCGYVESKGNPAYGANIPANVIQFLNNRTPEMQLYSTYGAFLAVEPTTNNIMAWGKSVFGGVIPEYVYKQLAQSNTRIINCSSTHSQFIIHIEIGNKRTRISWPQLGKRTCDGYLL